jgi:CRP-like cAMP-binding protein
MQSLKKFIAGDRILNEGDRGTEIYILMSGELSAWRGRSELGRLRGHGDLFGELSALTGRPRSATVVAATDAEVLCVQLEFKTVSQRMPEIMEKIDSAMSTRYEIARNKARMYASAAALARRRILHEVMVSYELARQGKKQAELSLRKNVRRQLDEDLARHGESDDPRILRRIADEVGVATDYIRETGQRVWLDESLDHRLEDLENRMLLLGREHTLTMIRERARVTADMLDLLAEYESLPGTSRELDLNRLEAIVPLNSRARALRTLHAEMNPDMTEGERVFQERRIAQLVENCRVSAGRDIVSLVRVAADLGVSDGYEDELRRVVSLSDTGSNFIDHPEP